MEWKHLPVSAGPGLFIIGIFMLVGFIIGTMTGNGVALGGVALLYIASDLYYRSRVSPGIGDMEPVGMLASSACFATALVTTGIRLFVTTPGLPLMAFWVYLLVAAGFMVSRCCLGWHVGASAAALTSFLAIGMFMQSLMTGGAVWAILVLFAAGLWWGADSWRRANGLTVNE